MNGIGQRSEASNPGLLAFANIFQHEATRVLRIVLDPKGSPLVFVTQSNAERQGTQGHLSFSSKRPSEIGEA